MEESNLAVDVLCITTPMGLFLSILLIEKNLPPLIRTAAFGTFFVPIAVRHISRRYTSLVLPITDTVMNRHESPLQFGDRCVQARSICSGSCSVLRVASRAAVVDTNYRVRCSAVCVRTGRGRAVHCISGAEKIAIARAKCNHFPRERS